MTIAYKTKPNMNGNSKRLVVNHDTRTYSEDGYASDIDITVKTKELKDLIAILTRKGYTRRKGLGGNKNDYR